MKKAKLIGALTLAISVLVGCSFGGFQPPKPYDIWLPGKGFYTATGERKFDDIYSLRSRHMRACDIDPVVGESIVAESNLCLEQKGWYLEGGPVCENELMWDQEVCIAWRKKHSRPDAKPWGTK